MLESFKSQSEGSVSCAPTNDKSGTTSNHNLLDKEHTVLKSYIDKLNQLHANNIEYSKWDLKVLLFVCLLFVCLFLRWWFA